MPLWAYFDASALVKRYSLESGTPLINEVFDRVRADRRLCLNLSLLEVISILVRKRNDRRLQEGFFREAMVAFKAEVISDEAFYKMSVYKMSVDDASILASSPLIEKHGLNATDAILLRSVLDTQKALRKRNEDLFLLASDKRLVRAAQSEGVLALDPEVALLSHLEAILETSGSQEENP